MNEEARELVKRLLEEGQRYDDVRREIISQGHNTENFESEYHAIQQKLGIEEPPPSPPTPEVLNSVMSEDAKRYSQMRARVDKKQWAQNFLKITAGVLVIALAVIFLSGFGQSLYEKWFGEKVSESEVGLSSEDFVLQAQARTFQQSAQAYKSRLIDYVDVCKSIGLDSDVYSCAETEESYAISVGLSDGSFFCVDSTGFAGIVRSQETGQTVCRK